MRIDSLFLAGAIAVAFCPAATAGDAVAAGIRVIDGDTIERGGVHYRLLGWDAPEIFRPKCIGERRKGQAATARLRALIDAAGTIRIVDSGEEDFFRRELASLMLDGVNAGYLLSREGLAKWSPDGSRQDWCTKIWPSPAKPG